ncbi:MAG: M28 family metallopeptidase [Promethearchaeota archaeon]
MIEKMDQTLIKYMHKFIEDVCTTIGPRESGTEQEILAGNKIEEELKKYCDETHQEEYISHPHAFLGGIRYGAILALGSIILYWLSLLIDLNILQLESFYGLLLIIIALIIVTLTISYFILNVMKYHEVFDFLFPKRESKNIIGTINPSGKIKNTIIFSAHHDSAFEFNTFYYLGRTGQVIINLGYLAVVIIFIVIIVKIIFHLLTNIVDFVVIFFSFGILFLIFTPIAFVYIFFHSYRPVLGAFDNLSGVAVVLGIGRYLNENKTNDKIFPKHTRIHLISFAGEEAGLRGSKRYIQSHFKELKETEAIVINMDGLAKKDIIIVIDKESGIGAKHNPEVVKSLYKIAKDINNKAKMASLPFGATDAAAFSKKEIPATCLGGLNLKEELAPYYHTRNDTPKVIEEEALGQAVQICMEYLKFIDSR